MPERPDEVARRIVREEMNELLSNLPIGIAGTEKRDKWLYYQSRLEEQIKIRDATKERRRASLAGLGYGIIGTAAGGLLTWATGALQWLLNFSTGRP